MPKFERYSFFVRWSALFVIALVALYLWNGKDNSLYAQKPQAIPTPAPTDSPLVDSSASSAVIKAQISPFLVAALADSVDDVSFLVMLKDQPNMAEIEKKAIFDANAKVAAVIATTPPTELTDFFLANTNRILRAGYIYRELTTHARESQAELRAWLDDQGIPYRAHYLVNMIQVTGDQALVDSLRLRPDVARLDPNPTVAAMHVTTSTSWARRVQMSEVLASPNAPNDMPYGVSTIGAPEVWAMGYRGEGIVVASQDTGVQWDHPALRPMYRGVDGENIDHTYNWLDAIPEGSSPDGCSSSGDAPCDDNGHGTHTVGTMLGKTDVFTYGVAPAAQWVGCRNMLGGVGTPESYTTCFEFFLAPYPEGGDPFTDGRPEFSPHIINNSWGCPPSEGCNKDSLLQVVENVRAAGIMVVASAGNNGGAGCFTVRDPIAIYDAAFSVGAHDSLGSLASFSSRGPVMVDGSGRLKPDLTAPGVNIVSTYRFSSATTLSGTSMAAPHVAGAVALLWSAAPWLVGNIDLTEQILLKSATPVPSPICGSESTSPNAAYGYGRLNVAAAVDMALQPWDVTIAVTDGRVTDSVDVPLVGATLRWIDVRTGFVVSSTTNASGLVQIFPTLAGEYIVEVETDAGTMRIENIVLVNNGIGGDPQQFRLDVRYDPAVTPYFEHLFLPGILRE